jgi:hypothetical protein
MGGSCLDFKTKSTLQTTSRFFSGDNEKFWIVGCDNISGKGVPASWYASNARDLLQISANPRMYHFAFPIRWQSNCLRFSIPLIELQSHFLDALSEALNNFIQKNSRNFETQIALADIFHFIYSSMMLENERMKVPKSKQPPNCQIWWTPRTKCGSPCRVLSFSPRRMTNVF